jgi:ribosomal protein L11 methyltransferase
LGAGPVWAVDIDPVATRATLEHLALNGLSGRATVLTGSTETLDEPVDLIVSNILAEAIAELAPEFARLARPAAWGLFSGLLTSQIETVEHSLGALGWQASSVLTERDWACVVGRFSPDATIS